MNDGGHQLEKDQDSDWSVLDAAPAVPGVGVEVEVMFMLKAHIG